MTDTMTMNTHTLQLTKTDGTTEAITFNTRQEAEAHVTTLNPSNYSAGVIVENTGHDCPGIRYCDPCQQADAAADDDRDFS